jgi:hypothetical protein
LLFGVGVDVDDEVQRGVRGRVRAWQEKERIVMIAR